MNVAENPEPGVAPLTILLVEDEVLIRMDLADDLRDAGWTVYEADSADAATELLRSHIKIDVIVTDVRMPGNMSGLELAGWVRTKRSGVKVVVISGDYRPHQEDESIVDGFFSKPFDSRLLIKTVQALTSGRQADAK